MRRSEWIVPLVGVVLTLVVLPLPAVQESGPVLLHQPVTAFERSSDLEIKVQALRKVKWVTLFYRFKADGEFVAQPLESPEKNLFRTSLATAQIPERQFEYYLACKSGGRVAYFPADVPEHFYSVKEIGEGPLPTPGAPAAEKGGFVFKVNLGGDLQGKVSEKTESTTDTVANTDQIGLTAGYKKEKFSLLADARTRVDTDPLSGENRLDLADLCVTLTHRSQMLRIGDISASESEFSLNTFGQRGMDYTFDNQQLYLHLLALNTQQLRGFKGFGIPRAATALYGGAAGVSFLNQTLSLKTVFLTGQDDPGQALNTGFTPYQYQPRQGDLFALVGETRLFQDRFSLKAEVARSSTDLDRSDTLPRQAGVAWQVQGEFSEGIFNFATGYRSIAKEFSPISQPFFSADRRGWDARLGVTGEKLSLDAALFLEQTNVADDPGLPTSRQTTGRVNLNWLISPATSLQVAFQRSQQSAWQNHSQLLSGDLLNGGFSAALNFTIGPSSQLNVQTQFDRVAESTSSGQRADALRLNLSGAFAFGSRFHINPFLGFSRMTDRINGQHELLTNAYVSGEWFFILPRLSLSFAGSFNGSQLPGQGTSHLLNLDSGVNWYAFKLLAGGTLVISLRTLFVDGRVQGINQSDFKVFIKADVAL